MLFRVDRVLGSHRRKLVTAVGDTTNVASRLQAKSAELGCSILISENTFQGAKEEIEAYPIKPVQLKGKTEAVMVYGVKGLKKKAGAVA